MFLSFRDINFHKATISRFSSSRAAACLAPAIFLLLKQSSQNTEKSFLVESKPYVFLEFIDAGSDVGSVGDEISHQGTRKEEEIKVFRRRGLLRVVCYLRANFSTNNAPWWDSVGRAQTVSSFAWVCDNDKQITCLLFTRQIMCVALKHKHKISWVN